MDSGRPGRKKAEGIMQVIDEGVWKILDTSWREL